MNMKTASILYPPKPPKSKYFWLFLELGLFLARKLLVGHCLP